MKGKIKVALYFVCLSLITLSLSYCNYFTSSEDEQRLFIENGFYSKVQAAEGGDIKYAVEFTYFVTGEKCNWGGFGIEMDSFLSGLDLYKMQVMEPGVKYQIAHTFKVGSILKNNPMVKIQGYKLGDSNTYKELYAEYTLQPK